MAVARVTIKGQVTIPRAIRAAMDIKPGDGVMFVIEGERVVMVPVKRQSLTELYGSLPVTKPHVAPDEMRRIVRDGVAQHVVGDSGDAEEKVDAA